MALAAKMRTIWAHPGQGMIRWRLVLSLSIAVTHELTCDKIEGTYILKDGDFVEKCEPSRILHKQEIRSLTQKSTVIHWHLEQEIPLDEDTPFTETIKLSLEEPKPDFKWGEEEYFPMKPDDDVEELLAKNPDGGKVTIPKAPKRHSMDIRIKKKQKLDEELKAKNRTDKEKESNTNRESQPAETDRTSRKEGNQQMTETERAPRPTGAGESDSNH